MSRYISTTENGKRIEEIASMDLCKWLCNDMCCNDSCDALGWFPSPISICENGDACGCFEKEDGIIYE